VPSPKGLEIGARENLGHKKGITLIFGCGNMVPASPHTASGENQFALWILMLKGLVV